MIKVSYTVRVDDRMGYTEDKVERFNAMSDAYKFLKRVMASRRLIGKPIVEDVQG